MNDVKHAVHFVQRRPGPHRAAAIDLAIVAASMPLYPSFWAFGGRFKRLCLAHAPRCAATHSVYPICCSSRRRRRMGVVGGA